MENFHFYDYGRKGYPLIIKSIFRNMHVFGSWNAQIFLHDLGYHWEPQKMQPPDLGCRKPCKYCDKLLFPQLVLAGCLNHLNLLFFRNPGRPNWKMVYEKESCKVKDIHIFYIWSRYNKHMIINRCVYTTKNLIISLHTILSIFYI